MELRLNMCYIRIEGKNLLLALIHFINRLDFASELEHEIEHYLSFLLILCLKKFFGSMEKQGNLKNHTI